MSDADDPLDEGDETMQLLELIASCSLQDVEDMKGRRKGKDSGGPLNDAELALDLFAEEAHALHIFARDMMLAHSIDQAVRADSGLLEEFARVEEIEREDREMARAMAEGRPLPNRTITAPSTRATPNSSTSTGRSSLSSSSTGTLNAFASSSANRLQVPDNKKAKAPPPQCVICRDDINGPVMYAPCGDAYDMECLLDLFRAATIDESLFPPSCCRRPFELATVRGYLSKELAALVDQKTIEFGTKNRVYCHRPACSSFLGAATSSPSSLVCFKCWEETCGHCKAAAHSASFHCTSEGDAQVLALAEEAGWKRCPGCGHLVELSIGCYHMTCRCRHQFCYLCSATWKTCRCVQWDDNRLVDAAQDRVERRQRAQGAAAVPLVNYRQVVAQEVENLRVNHECANHRWRYVAQPGNCEGCGHFLRVFLFHCDHCYTRMCARCRRNRWFPW